VQAPRVQLWIELFLREAARALRRHALRSALTTLGIAIGIAAVVLVVALGQAGAARAEDALQQLGDNLVWIEAGSRNSGGVRTGSHGTTSLTLEDAEAIGREVPLLTRVSPQIDGTLRLAHGNRNWLTRWRGETPEYLAIKKWEVARGIAFSHEDVRQSASKLLIGQTVRDQLFLPSEEPLGSLVRVNAQVFEVVGVLAPKGQSPDGRDQDDWVLLPHTTAQTRLRGKGPQYLDDILCSASSRAAVNPAIDQVTALLRQRHGLGQGDEDDFNIRRPDEVLKAQVEVSNTLALLLLAVASIALLVGGIGVMNVMLASVAQRTREIGVRLSFGATPGQVELQFLGEAVTLCVVGGLAGVALSFAARSALGAWLGWALEISPRAVAVAVGASVVVGLLSGLYPARKAAALDPIEALRRE
jgi:putative ABC transport system permease protein